MAAFTPTERGVLGTACLAHGTIHVYELAVPALLVPIQAEFGVGDYRMGLVVTLYAWLFGLGSLPAGFLVDRIGARKLLAACMWGSALAVLGMALSPTLPVFAVSAAVMGAALSIYHPAGTALISHRLEPSGRVFAFHGMAGNFGVAIAGALAGLLGQAFGWRVALGTLSVLGLALGARVLSMPAGTREDEVAGTAGNGRSSNWLPFVLLLIAAGSVGMVYRGLTTFLPKLFATGGGEEVTTGTAAAGMWTTAALICGLGGMWLAGRLVDRGMSAPAVYLLGAALQVPLLLLMVRAGTGWLAPLAMGVAFFQFMTQPPGNQLVARLTPPRLRGLGYGVYFFLVFGVGALGATIAGHVSERLGLVEMFGTLALVLVPALVASVWLVLRERRTSEPRPVRI